MSEEKYFQTLVTIEILGNDPYERPIDCIQGDITDGLYSGAEFRRRIVETSREEMRERLIEQGSDPSFLIHEPDDFAALKEVYELALRWEQQFTGVGAMHDAMQEAVSQIRFTIQKHLGEDWY